MIGLDTNVIVRYLVQDDPKQSKLANHFIENAIATKETLAISSITICEIVLVLERCYAIDRDELVNVLKKILLIQQIWVENDMIVRQALCDFEHHAGVDFSDCLIGRLNFSKECSFTYTFDKKAAKKLPTLFKLIK